MHSQNLSTNKRERGVLTEIEVDSAYLKIQRGKVNAERVRILQKDIFLCDSVSNLKTELIGIKDTQLLVKDSIIANDNTIFTELKSQVKKEIKRGRRRAFWSFLKGTGLGIVIMAILQLVLL